MASIQAFITLLFATAGAAQLTTSLPEGIGATNTFTVGYVGSVIAVQNDATTFALVYDEDTLNRWSSSSSHELSSRTITRTYSGTTAIYQTWTTDLNRGDPDATTAPRIATYGMNCDIESSTAVCSSGSHRSYDFENLCEGQTGTLAPDQATTIEIPYGVFIVTDENGSRISTGEFSYSSFTKTVDLGFCKTGSQLPDSVAYYTTQTWQMGHSNVVITAGQEKLGPTAGSSPTPTGTQPTGTGAAKSGETGAAPRITFAPVWAGLGAAAAALAL